MARFSLSTSCVAVSLGADDEQTPIRSNFLVRVKAVAVN